MSGNVYEWCDDFSTSSINETYNSSTIDDYLVNPVVSTHSQCHNIRGVCWDWEAEYSEIVGREFWAPYSRYSGVGFRVCCTIN